MLNSELLEKLELGTFWKDNFFRFKAEHFKKKLYSTFPEIRVNDIEWFPNIRRNDLMEFLNNNEDILEKYGVSAVFFYKDEYGYTKLIPIDSITDWQKIGTLNRLSFITQISQGTYPVMVEVEVGKVIDKIVLKKMDEDKTMILNEKEIVIEHNLGIVKGYVFQSKYSYEQQKLGLYQEDNKMIIPLLEKLDLLEWKMVNEIILRTTTIGYSFAEGTTNLTKEEYEEGAKNFIQGIRENYVNGIRIVNFNFSNEDGGEFQILPDTPQLKELRDEFNATYKMIADIVGLGQKYDTQGTNDVKAKIDSIDDASQNELNWRKANRQLQLEELFSSIYFFEKGEKVEKLEVNLFITDTRKKMELIEKNPQIISLLPTKEILKEVFGFSDAKAERLFEEKEDEIKKSIVSFILANNGNMPQTLSGGIIGLEWFDNTIMETNDGKNKQNTTSGKKGSET